METAWMFEGPLIEFYQLSSNISGGTSRGPDPHRFLPLEGGHRVTPAFGLKQLPGEFQIQFHRIPLRALYGLAFSLAGTKHMTYILH